MAYEVLPYRRQRQRSMSVEAWLDHLQLTRRQARQKALDDLFFLNKEVLGCSVVYTPLHEPLCRQFQEAPWLSLWLIPRGHLKTTLFTVGGSIWHKLRNPDICQMITTAKIATTLTIGDQIKRHFLRTERLRYLFPEFALPETKSGQGRRHEFSLPGRSSYGKRETCFVMAAVDASQVSRHFDRITCDDLVTDRHIKTSEAMEAVKEHWRSLWAMADDQMVVIGTRWDQDDLYGDIISAMQSEGALIRVMSCWGRGKDGRKTSIYPKDDEGRSQYPVSKLQVFRKPGVMGAYHFSCQYENDPIPDTAQRILHPTQVLYVNRVPDGVYNFIFVDPAFSTDERSDRLAIVVVATDHERNFYVRDVIAGMLTPKDAARWIHTLTTTYQPRGVFMESNCWQAIYRQHVMDLIQREGGNVYITEVPRKNRDTAWSRVMGLQPFFEEGRIFFLRGGRGVADAVNELTRWSKRRAKQGGRDDICSALSDAPVLAFFPPRPGRKRKWSMNVHWDDLRNSTWGDFEIPSHHVLPRMALN